MVSRPVDHRSRCYRSVSPLHASFDSFVFILYTQMSSQSSRELLPPQQSTVRLHPRVSPLPFARALLLLLPRQQLQASCDTTLHGVENRTSKSSIFDHLTSEDSISSAPPSIQHVNASWCGTAASLLLQIRRHRAGLSTHATRHWHRQSQTYRALP